jgi:hypothetical protein
MGDGVDATREADLSDALGAARSLVAAVPRVTSS